MCIKPSDAWGEGWREDIGREERKAAGVRSNLILLRHLELTLPFPKLFLSLPFPSRHMSCTESPRSPPICASVLFLCELRHLFPHSLNVAWPCDLLWPVEYDRGTRCRFQAQPSVPCWNLASATGQAWLAWCKTRGQMGEGWVFLAEAVIDQWPYSQRGSLWQKQEHAQLRCLKPWPPAEGLHKP